MDQLDRISQIIEEYDSQGFHRTGTDTDHESANWLAQKVHNLGLETVHEKFDLNRVIPISCNLTIDNRVIEGLPMFDCVPTDSSGISGSIGNVGDDVDIAIIEIHHGAAGYTDELMEARTSGRYKGIVAVTIGERPGLMAINTPDFNEHFGVPILQVSSEEKEFLSNITRFKTVGNLVVNIEFEESESYNIVSGIKGQNSSLSPIVVMTPRSGWWHCASERGGGIACWLEVMRAIKNEGSLRDVFFVATSAHELGAQGIHAFLDSRPEFAQQVHTWIHFGANVGASQMPGARYSTTDEALALETNRVLNMAGIYDVNSTESGIMLGRESLEVSRRGGRIIALVGTNALFHLESDRWPESVDVNKVASFSNAFIELSLELTKS